MGIRQVTEHSIAFELNTIDIVERFSIHSVLDFLLKLHLSPSDLRVAAKLLLFLLNRLASGAVQEVLSSRSRNGGNQAQLLDPLRNNVTALSL